MGARQKLNEITIQGCLVVAGLIALACGSWLVFIVALLGLLGLSLFLGDIRPNQNGFGGQNSTRPHPPRRSRPTRRR